MNKFLIVGEFGNPTPVITACTHYYVFKHIVISVFFFLNVNLVLLKVKAAVDLKKRPEGLYCFIRKIVQGC